MGARLTCKMTSMFKYAECPGSLNLNANPKPNLNKASTSIP